MRYLALLVLATHAFVTQSGAFRIGSKRVSVSHDRSVARATFAQVLTAVEMAASGKDATLQFGAVKIVISEWGSTP